jgi:hypothetical protein
MDKSKTKLTENQRQFFDSMTIAIDKPVYFYGSINRPDYIPGKSDIDVDIFTDNENSTLKLLSNFLDVTQHEIKKTVIKINTEVIYGHKVQYEDIDKGINVEMSIFNDDYKQTVLTDHNKNQCLPIYITIVLVIVKYMFYNLEIITKKQYKRCKQFLMNSGDEMKFIELIE